MTSLSERLLSPWTLYTLALGLVLALLAVFPAQRLLDMEDPQRSNDQNAALLYAQASLRSAPERFDYRLRLAKLQLEVGEIDAAGETLEPIAHDASLEAQWWMLKYYWKRYIDTFGSDDQEAVKEVLITRMNRYILSAQETAREAGELADSQRLEALAMHWLALDRPERAATSYETLAHFDTSQRFQWYSEAGRYWLQAGQPAQAAQAWYQAWRAGMPSAEADPSHETTSTPASPPAARSTSLARRWLDWLIPASQAQSAAQPPEPRRSRREAARQSLLAAQQSGDTDQALQYVIEYLDAYPNDRELLDIAVRIALAGNQPQQALEWSQRLVNQRPEDSQLLSRHAAIAIALDKPPVAIDTLLTLRRLEPDNPGHLENLYHAYRWSGRSRPALDSLIELAKRTGDPAREREVVELARGLYDRQTALAALRRLQEKDAMNLADKGQLVELLDQLGRPDDAIAQLRQWQAQGHAEWNLTARLATLLEQVGELDAAARVWADLAGQTPDANHSAARQHSRLLTRQWQLEDAQQVLAETPAPRDAAAAQDYWRRRADIAYLLGSATNASRSLQQLDRRDALRDYEKDVLMQAAYEQRDIGLVTRLAKRRWRADADPDGVVQGFQLAQAMRRPDVARELLALAEEAPKQFESSADYWAVRGEQHIAQGAAQDAVGAYRRARTLAPQRLDLDAGLLYALIAAGRYDTLQARLTQWQARGDESLGMALALADGYQALGQTGRALAWQRRIESQYPLDPQRLLNASSLLRQLGQDRQVYAASRLAMARLMPVLTAQLAQPLQEADLHDQVGALTSMHSYLGGDRKANWHDALITQLDGMDYSAANQGELALQTLEALGQRARYRYLWLRRERAGLATMPNHAASVALQRNDQARLKQLLDTPDLALDKETRFYINQHLGRYDTALEQANDLHDAGGDFRADIVNLRQQLPNRVSARLRHLELGDLGIAEEQVRLERSTPGWSGRLQLGKRHLSTDALKTKVDAAGLVDEWFGEVALIHRGRRLETELSLGAIDSDDAAHVTAGIRQSLAFSSRVKGSLFADLGEPSEAGELQRLLAVEDQIGVSLNWSLTARDHLFLNARKLWYRGREDRPRLGDGSRYELSFSHLLIEGPSRSVELQLFASHERQDAASRLPGSIVTRFPDDRAPAALFDDDSTFLGGGISVARGLPGSAFPSVASPRFQLTLSGGQRWPSRDLAGSMAIDIGSRLFGGDELSIGINLDDGTGVDDTTRFGAHLTYQIFLGR